MFEFRVSGHAHPAGTSGGKGAVVRLSSGGAEDSYRLPDLGRVIDTPT